MSGRPVKRMLQRMTSTPKTPTNSKSKSKSSKAPGTPWATPRIDAALLATIGRPFA
jgi:hypothetical protein